MRKSHRSRRARPFVWAAAIGLLVLAGGVEPSQAMCVRGNLAVHRQDQTDVTLLQESQCLVWTPWPDVVDVHWDDGVAGLPSGAPRGAKVDLWVPLP